VSVLLNARGVCCDQYPEKLGISRNHFVISAGYTASRDEHVPRRDG
jgi:hypothetical protein